VARWVQCSGSRREPDHLPPLLEPLGSDLAILLGRKEVAAGAEVVTDGAEGLQELLRVVWRLKALEL
jgi:hypothetical protein